MLEGGCVHTYMYVQFLLLPTLFFETYSVTEFGSYCYRLTNEPESTQALPVFVSKH